MAGFRQWFRREGLSRTTLLARGFALMFFPFAAVVFLSTLLDYIPWMPPALGAGHVLFFAVLLLWNLLLTFAEVLALWFFAGLIRPLSWMTPVAVLALLLTLLLLMAPVFAALAAFGQLLAPGARLFGGT